MHPNHVAGPRLRDIRYRYIKHDGTMSATICMLNIPRSMADDQIALTLAREVRDTYEANRDSDYSSPSDKPKRYTIEIFIQVVVRSDRSTVWHSYKVQVIHPQPEVEYKLVDSN